MQRKRLSEFFNKHSLAKGMFVLGLFLVCGGVWSLLKGQDVSFDLLNYHLYLPYAFLNGRFGQDLIAAGAIHSFFNPLLDIPYYLVFTYLNDWPRLTAFLQGLWYGAFLFFAWRICSLLFPHFRSAQAKILRLAAFLLGATGMATAGSAGMVSSDLAASTIQLAALYLLLKEPSSALAPRRWAWAAFLCCAAAGMKYTAATACIGLGMAGLWLWWQHNRKSKTLLICGLCGLAGFLLTAGYFMWRNWNWTGNPFFPYFNTFFQSSYFSVENLSNGWAVPSGIKEAFLIPFSRLHFVLEFRIDYRILFGYLAAFLLVLLAFLRVWRPRAKKDPFAAIWLVFVFSYIPWVFLFASMRYAAMLEFCGALLAVYALRRVFGAVNGSVLAVVLCIFVFWQPYPDWSRQGFLKQNQTFFNLPKVEDDSMVLLGGHVSFLVSAFNPKAQYIGGIWFRPQEHPDKTRLEMLSLNRLQPSDYEHRFDDLIRQKVCRHSGHLYVLGPWTDMMWRPVTWQRYGVRLKGAPENCRFFNSSINVGWKGFVLCPAVKNCP